MIAKKSENTLTLIVNLNGILYLNHNKVKRTMSVSNFFVVSVGLNSVQLSLKPQFYAGPSRDLGTVTLVIYDYLLNNTFYGYFPSVRYDASSDIFYFDLSDPKLVNGQMYGCTLYTTSRIQALNNVNFTPGSPTKVPAITNITRSGNQIELSWKFDILSNEGGYKGFKVYQNNIPISTLTNVSKLTFFAPPAISNDAEYKYEVSVFNDVAERKSYPLLSRPIIPPMGNFRISSIGNATVTFNWEKLSGQPVTPASMKLRLINNSTGTQTTITDGIAFNGTTYSCTITGGFLSNKYYYTANVMVKFYTTDTATKTTNLIKFCPGPPSKAPVITSTSRDKGQMSLFWTYALASDESTFGFVGFNIYQNNILVKTVTNMSTLCCNVPDILDIDYTYQVSVKNAMGELKSAVVRNDFPRPPDVPVLLSATTGFKSVQLKWNAVRQATFYTVFKDGVVVPLSIQGTDTSVTVPDLTYGSYKFTLQAGNDLGNSAKSDFILGTALDNPSKVTTFKVTDLSSTTVSVEWLTPAVFGSTSMSKYVIYNGASPLLLNSSPIEFPATVQTPGAKITATFDRAAIPEWTIIYLSVMCINDATYQSQSNVFKIAAPPRSIVTDVVAIPQNNGAILKWTYNTSENELRVGFTVYTATYKPAYRYWTYNFLSIVSTNTATIANLQNGTAYTFVVAPFNSYDKIIPDQSAKFAVTPLASAGNNGTAAGNEQTSIDPFIPPQFTASPVAGDTVINLQWDTPALTHGSPIDEYRVYVDNAVVGTTKANSYTVTNLINGKQYVFQVQGVNTSGDESDKSFGMYGTPVGGPQAPSIASVVPGVTSLTVHLNTPVGNDLNPATLYTVFVDGNARASGGSSPITVTGLVTGKHITAKAQNAASQTSPASAAVLAKPGVPTAPSNVTFAAAPSGFNVSFTPSDNNGSAISMYKVNVQSGDTTTAFYGETSPVRVFADTTKLYVVTVSATNTVGESPLSDKAYTLVKLPPIITRIENGDGAITLYLDSNQVFEENVKAYKVYANGALKGTYTTKTITVSGLQNGPGQSYTASAVYLDDSETSQSVAVVASPGSPSKPTVTVVSAGDASVTLSITPPEFLYGSSLSRYNIYQNNVLLGTSAELSYTATGLANGVQYSFQVSAVSGLGEGALSDAVLATPSVAPFTPVIVSAVPKNGAADVHVSVDNGGSPITAYLVYNNGSLVSDSSVTFSGTVVTVGGLVNNVLAVLSLKAVNVNGESPASLEVNVTPGVPSAPTLVDIDQDLTSAKATYTPSIYDGGFPITTYTLYAYQIGSDGIVVPDSIVSSTTDTVSPLAPGTDYIFYVAASNSLFEGPVSDAINRTTGVPKPVSVKSIATSTDGTAATVTFTTKPVTGTTTTYTLDTVPRVEGAVITTGGLAPRAVANEQLTISGLEPSVSYTITVIAYTEYGSSSSSPSEVTTGAPDAPTITSYEPLDGGLRARVRYSPASTGPLPTSYDIYLDGVLENNTAGLYSDIPLHTSLTAGQSYTVTVVAKNDVGSSPSSAPYTVNAYTVPSAPVLTSVSTTVGVATVYFTPSASNGGNAITAYNVYANDVLKASSLTSPVTLTGLTSPTPYNIYVRAENARGESLSSISISGVSTLFPPAAPTGVRIASNTKDAETGLWTIVVVWTPPTDTGGSPLTQYTVKVYNSAGVLKKEQGPLWPAARATAIEGLDNDTQYSVVVIPENIVGPTALPTPLVTIVGDNDNLYAAYHAEPIVRDRGYRVQLASVDGATASTLKYCTFCIHLTADTGDRELTYTYNVLSKAGVPLTIGDITPVSAEPKPFYRLEADGVSLNVTFLANVKATPGMSVWVTLESTVANVGSIVLLSKLS